MTLRPFNFLDSELPESQESSPDIDDTVTAVKPCTTIRKRDLMKTKPQSSTLVNIYVVWNPGTDIGEMVYKALLEHYHSDVFSGLPGGSIEVYCRTDSKPGHRSKKILEIPEIKDSDSGTINVIVPIVDTYLDSEIQKPENKWKAYIDRILQFDDSKHLVLPVVVDNVEVTSDSLLKMYNKHQYIVVDSTGFRRCWKDRNAGDLRNRDRHIIHIENVTRDVSQAITQHYLAKQDDDNGSNTLTEDSRKKIRVFINHTKQDAGKDLPKLYEKCIERIYLGTRLAFIFDMNSFQTGMNWQEILRDGATGHNSAILMIRNDEFSRRLWTQREIRLAKECDIPIVALNGLLNGDNRGSYFLDNVPVVPLPYEEISGKKNKKCPWKIGTKGEAAIQHSINLLIDECLKKQLLVQAAKNMHKGGNNSSIHTFIRIPEPVALLGYGYTIPGGTTHRSDSCEAVKEFLISHRDNKPTKDFFGIYPDPPMTKEEKEELDHIGRLISGNNSVNLSSCFRTPRQIEMDPSDDGNSNSQRLIRKTVGLTMSMPKHLDRLGLSPSHVNAATMTFARYTFVEGGRILFGGRTPDDQDENNLTAPICREAENYGALYRERGDNGISDHTPVSTHIVPWTVVTEEKLWHLYNFNNKNHPDSVFAVVSPDGEKVYGEGKYSIKEALDELQRLKHNKEVPESSVCHTEFRKVLAERTDLRIALGGWVSHDDRHYESGSRPGVLEEIKLTLRNETPIYLLGGYGGVTRYLLSRLFRRDSKKFTDVDFGIDETSFATSDKGGVAKQELDEILEIWNARNLCDEKTIMAWSGLSKDDYLRMAISQRPAEIMSFVLKGFERVTKD